MEGTPLAWLGKGALERRNPAWVSILLFRLSRLLELPGRFLPRDKGAGAGPGSGRPARIERAHLCVRGCLQGELLLLFGLVLGYSVPFLPAGSLPRLVFDAVTILLL